MKTACITGATAGFGEAMAKRFVQEGWRVIGTGRRTERLEALKNELGADVFYPLAFDVTDVSAMQAAVASLPPAWQQIDALVNNAGGAKGLEKTQDGHLEDWFWMIDTNIKGLLAITRELLPRMLARNTGHVVNIGSVAGNYAYPGGNIYCGTKAFVNHFTQCLKADVVGTGVRVTSIEPGIAETEFSQVRFKGDNDKAANVYKNTVSMTADDIAEAVYWSVTLPAHLNVNRMELMPTYQSCSALNIVRGS